MLTIDAPNSPRLLIVIPAVVLLAGSFVQRSGQLLSAYPRRVKILLLIVVFALTALLNMKIYFYDFAQDLSPGNLTAGSIAREIKSADESAQVFLLGQPQLFADSRLYHDGALPVAALDRTLDRSQVHGPQRRSVDAQGVDAS